MLLGDSPEETANLRKGIELLGKGEYLPAIDRLKAAMRIHAFSDLARIYLSDAYARAGMPDKAEQIIMVEPYRYYHGGSLIHLDTEYHDVMRQVGAEYRVPVLDARAVLGPGDYIDGCHFDADGHEKVARMLYETVSGTLQDE